jgi:RNA polymerase sigma-70 factor (ECF subfamily)
LNRVIAPDDANIREETRLVDAAKSGSLPAFNSIVLRHQDIAYGVAFRLLGDPDAAADVVQDSFLSAWRNLKSFRGDSIRPWLLRIVTNECLDHLRHKKRRPSESLDQITEADPSLDPPSPEDGPERLALRRESIVAIERALLGIPVVQRTAIVLHDIHGLSYEEIADVCSVEVGTIKSRISRGRSQLRDLIGSPRELLA